VKTSSYNFAVPGPTDGWILFNARTGKILQFSGGNSEALKQYLTAQDAEGEVTIDHQTEDLLKRSEFIIEDEFDEVAAIKSVYWGARHDAPVVVTITTTLDCNLGCFYCYEERTTDALTGVDISSIVQKTRDLINSSGRNSIHVDWYGGEPTLNLDFLEAASFALQNLCEKLKIRYTASIISNGTAWPDDVDRFIATHRIRQAQITFDGLKTLHDQRRRFTKASDFGRSSFDEASLLVSKLIDLCRVDIRYNVDERNKADFQPFVALAASRGWFRGTYPSTFQPARVGAYTEKSRFVERIELSDAEFREMRKQAAVLLREGTIEEPEAPSGYAAPKKSVCAALSNNAIVVGADRNLYRCGLQVSEPHRAVGVLGSTPFNILSGNHSDKDEEWWRMFDPTDVPSCSSCSFLPVCLGGCPKKQLENDRKALHEQSLYWRENLPRLIYKTVGLPDMNVQFSEADQFRTSLSS